MAGRSISSIFIWILIAIFAGLTSLGCAYRLGSPERSLPGGYHQVFVPVFKNLTMEPGIEVYFTNSMVQEIERSQKAHVAEDHHSEVQVIGTIKSLQYLPNGKKAGDSGNNLPPGVVIASEYRILLVVDVRLERASDHSVLWSGTFSDERTFLASQVFEPHVNSVNSTYNLSAKRQNIQAIAPTLMAEAFQNMTENF